jgi:ATP phosphoribosyltransferase
MPHTREIVRFVLPKGRLLPGVTALLQNADICLTTASRNYRPQINIDGFSIKIFKPRSVVELLNVGAHDLGFACNDWVTELQADLIELLDTGLDPIRLVAAAPKSFLLELKQPVRIASEYENITRRWIQKKNWDATFIRSYGSTESFPPEDADCIIDNTATGTTLAANNLCIFDDLMTCSTRLYATQQALENPTLRVAIEALVKRLRLALPNLTQSTNPC